MGRDDTELIGRWRRGDSVAFEELVRRWQAPIGRFLARQLGRTEQVADLCQEVFLRVYRAGPRYRESGAFSTWLYRIALNLARDAARRRRKLRPLPDDLAQVAPAESPCEQRERIAAVSAALADLPENLREVLVLRHYEGLSFEQIARILDTPASTLKSRFAAALDRMRTRLAREGWGTEETDS
jgi:RNA polymerase sigma-70 factor (ECF subfamily)